MKIISIYGFIVFIIVMCVPLSLKAQQKIKITGYYGGWMQGWYNNGRLPSSEVDYNSLDYIIHFGIVPNSDGTIDSLSNSIIKSNSDPLISEAHAQGKKVLICIGGWGTSDYFRGATSFSNVLFFVTGLVNFMKQRGYDGIDVDWEVLEHSDSVQYTNFIKLLRSSLNLIGGGKIITLAAAWQPTIIAAVQQYVDQVNLMTYDLSGAWPGWVSWYNSPVYSAGNSFPSTGELVPSIDQMVNDFVSAGVEKSKIAIGIDFYGYIWRGGDGTSTGGVSAPLQTWNDPPSVEANVPYYEIMDNYYKPDYYHWDPNAEACYLQIDSSCSENDMFITYDDARSCKAKVDYAIKNGLAGVFIWEIGAGVTSDNQQRLIKEVKTEAAGVKVDPTAPSLYSPPNGEAGSSPPLVLSWFPSDDAESYHMQVSTDQNFNSILIDSVTSDKVSTIISSLNPQQKYYWRVSASNNSGSSSFTQPFEFTTSGSTLTPPLPVAPSNGDAVLPNNAKFTWNSIPNAGSYRLQVSGTPDFCEKDLDTLIQTDTTVHLTSLQRDVQYFWRVMALPKSGNFSASQFSVVESFTTSNSAPEIPLALQPYDGSQNISIRPTLIWQTVKSAQSYEVRLALNSNFSHAVLDSAGITSNRLKIDSLDYKTTYYWGVRAINNVGKSDWSRTYSFTTADTTGAGPEVPTSFNIRNYPNPFNNSTTIQFDIPFKCSVKIYITDLTGKLVKTILTGGFGPGTYNVPFSDDNLASGVYFYTIMAIYGPAGHHIHLFVSGKMILLK